MCEAKRKAGHSYSLWETCMAHRPSTSKQSSWLNTAPGSQMCVCGGKQIIKTDQKLDVIGNMLITAQSLPGSALSKMAKKPRVLFTHWPQPLLPPLGLPSIFLLRGFLLLYLRKYQAPSFSAWWPLTQPLTLKCHVL